MTGTNDCELTRVYTSLAPPPNSISDETIKSNQDFRVVIDAEAGSALFNLAGSYLLKIDVVDLTDSVPVNSQQQAGTFGDANWPALTIEFPFTVGAQGATKENHVYEVVAVVTAGGADPIVDFERSDLFIITKP